MDAALLRRFLRPALAFALIVPACPPAASAQPAPLSAEAFLAQREADLHNLYGAASAIGAQTYEFYLYFSGNEAAARRLAASGQALHAQAGLSPRRLPAYVAPQPLREQLQRLQPGQVSPVFQPLPGQWALVELKAVDRRPSMPAFAALRDQLLLLAARGALPPPETLRDSTAAAAPVLDDELPAGGDIDQLLPSGYTALQQAVLHEQLDRVKSLLARQADPNHCPVDACPLQLALQSTRGTLPLVQALLKAGAKPDQLPAGAAQDTAFVLACRNNRLDVAKLLLEKGADPEGGSSMHKPMTLALASPDTTLLRLLLKHGARPDGADDTPSPLQLALAAGNRDQAELLLAHGADPLLSRPLPGGGDRKGTPLAVALATGKPELTAWFRSVVQKKLASQAEYRWSAWIEQEVLAPPSKDPNAPLVQVLKMPLKPGARITLNRDYFTLKVRLHPRARLRLEASDGDAFFSELDHFGAAGLFSRARDNAAASRAGPLLVSESRARRAHPEQVGGVLVLNPGSGDFDRVEKSADGPVYVRIIDRVKLDKGNGATTSLLDRSGLHELNLVLGTEADYSEALADFVNAQKVTLVFR